MTSGTTTTNEDWRYSDARMKLRQEVYTILLKKFGAELNDHGAPVHSMEDITCLLYTSPSPRDGLLSRMPSSA